MFYLQYAARNFWRNRRWSLFAVFSIAAGVATIVALRSLGLAIGDSLTSNLRAANHGDITITDGVSGGFAFNFGEEGGGNSGFSASEIQNVTDWVEARGGDVTAYFTTSGVQIAKPGSVTAGRPQFVTTIFIDPATYPPSHTITALDPPGAPLSTLLTGGNEVVISKNLADTQGLAVGDKVRVSGTEEEFVVRGIVPTEHEAGLRNLFAAFFGFAYFDLTSAKTLSLDVNPNSISLTLPENLAPQTLDQAHTLEDELRGLLSDRGRHFLSVPDLRQQNQTIADYTGQFIVVMGLGAMLIGGVGIVNTMLVMVRRRTEEIAALKTFGLKGRQVAALFMVEALLLGLAGSVLGSLLGMVLSRLANAYGETLIQQPLVWRLQPEALLFGVAIGLIVSGVFGVLPVLTAVKIRPGIILRPNETHVPRAGVLQSLLALLLVVLALGLIAGQILNNIAFGLIGTAATLLVLGILIGLLWIVVWLLGRIPAFGSVDLKLALRNLRSKRVRTATTLLALSAGMFALSSIAFFGAGMRQILQTTLTGTLGGNVMIFPILPAAIADPLIDSKLNSLEGVISRTRFVNYSARVTAVNGEPVDSQGITAQRNALRNEIRQANRQNDFANSMALNAQLADLPDYTIDISVRETTGTDIGGKSVAAGRGLTMADVGKPVMLLREDMQKAQWPIGTILTLEIDGKMYDFELVGLESQASMTFGEAVVPPGVITSPGSTDIPLTLVDIDPQYLDQDLLALSALPLTFSIDISFIDGLMRRFIDQFSALPILVGLLSLGAAAVIMANTVALATLERRRQIGILKAVGLKGRRVLGVMLLENLLVSLLGGLLGVGLSALGVAIMSIAGIQATILIPTDATPVAVALIVAAVVIGAVATILSAQVAINERALNVLRYD